MPGKSLVGNVYGDIKAIEYIGGKRYKCQCIKCGELSEQYSTNLKGIMECQKCGRGYRVDLTGKHYGLLKVKEYDKQTKKWVCECECGRRIKVKSNNLKSGNTLSCGRCMYEKAARRDVVGGTRVSQIGKAINKNNTSGITGVGYNKRKNKWYASIRFCGKDYWLGYYADKEDATQARKAAERQLHGNFIAWLEDERKCQRRKNKKEERE